jgi:hypothetical protein
MIRLQIQSDVQESACEPFQLTVQRKPCIENPLKVLLYTGATMTHQHSRYTVLQSRLVRLILIGGFLLAAILKH